MIFAILAVPLAISLLFAGALLAIWRRRPGAAHAASWGCAFAMIAAGWLMLMTTTFVLGVARLSGATASLCWLAAALALVHGMRQRAGRPDRASVLGAIWIAISLAIGLLSDLAPVMAGVIAPTIALLSGLGLLLAAVAVGPRIAPRGRFDWCATTLLIALACAELTLAWLLLAAVPLGAAPVALVALGASVGYVALGLGAVLLLNRDLGIALERVARTDPLTGVWNRRGFDEAAPHLLARMRGVAGDLAAVAIADIDSFKAINDRFGHTTGDAVLVDFAAMLGHAVQPGDLLARLGGEEFALLAIGVDADELFARVDHVRALVCVPSEGRAGLPPITASFGVAQLHARTLSLRDALERADRALYQAKRAGRNRTVVGAMPGAAAE